MSDEAWAPLESLAAAHGVTIFDSWGQSSLVLRDNLDIEALYDIAGRSGFNVRLLFDNADLPLTVSPGIPDVDELQRLRNILGNEREQAQLAAAATTADAVGLLGRYLSGAFVEYSHSAWVRTEKTLFTALREDWVKVAFALSGHAFHCGSETIELEPRVGPEPPGAVPVVVVKDPKTVREPLRQGLTSLADAAAWTQLAVRTTVEGTRVRSALHQDQDEIIGVDPELAAGANALLEWRMRDNAVNREEALRHVLRVVTAGAAVLPAAQTVKTLAERQYIALSRDRAAEVFHSISEAQRTTADLLKKASESLSKLVEDTTTTASSTVAAVIGLVAFIVQKSNLLPAWLVLAAAVVASCGVAAVVASRWRRIKDQLEAAARLEKRLDTDPLLPAEDRDAMKALVNEAELATRSREARARILVLGASASAVALAAAGWLVWRSPPH